MKNTHRSVHTLIGEGDGVRFGADVTNESEERGECQGANGEHGFCGDLIWMKKLLRRDLPAYALLGFEFAKSCIFSTET